MNINTISNPIQLTFRRVAYHTDSGDGGGEKYWQIMRGSASPEERNGLGGVDFSATEDLARNGARFDIYFNIKFIASNMLAGLEKILLKCI